MNKYIFRIPVVAYAEVDVYADSEEEAADRLQSMDIDKLSQYTDGYEVDIDNYELWNVLSEKEARWEDLANE